MADFNTNDRGYETHPSFGMAQVNRVSSGGGVSLFDSELRHREFVSLRISTAERKRDLNHDWIHADNEFTEIWMSMAQWGALVSSFGTSGVPVTLHRVNGEIVEPAEHTPRMAESLREVDAAADKYTEKIADATTALREAFDNKAGRKEMEKRIWDLEIQLRNTKPNLNFVAKSLSEHVENTVTKARADIEAMVSMAHQQGLAAGPEVLGLMGGDDEA